MKYKILIVDDEPANLRVLERLFRRDYQVISAESGAQALELLNSNDFELIISDQRMPGMTGIEFLKQAAEIHPHTIRIILTGYTDVVALIEAINSRIIYKYVSKPWINEDLQQTVNRALGHYETTKSQQELKQQNRRLSDKLKATELGFVQFIGEVLNSRDRYAYDHALRTQGHAVAIGHQLDLQPEEIERLANAAYLIEIGNIGVPDHILQKEEALSDEEQQIVERRHETGARMLEGIPGLQDIASVIRHQHKHYDGSGSAEHLQGEGIPLHAQIIAVASAYDSMTNPRSSQKSLSHMAALEQLKINTGKQFDPLVVEAFCRLESARQIL
jgi:response regulator RpfG family c-di-GMP phosphodiesterase